jgi:hypothetical protein
MVQLLAQQIMEISMYKFKSYGPFKVPIANGRVAVPKLDDFWNEIERTHPRLSDAVGCYIFATHARGSALPWYVGKTEKASFKREAFQPSKRENYQDALTGRKRGVSELYLIAKTTPAGNFRRSTKSKGGVRSIRKLEELLIGACLLKNSKLVNKSTAKNLKNIQVPGYMNDAPGKRSKGADHLAKLLAT